MYFLWEPKRTGGYYGIDGRGQWSRPYCYIFNKAKQTFSSVVYAILQCKKTDIFQPNRTVPNPSNEGSFPSLLISAKLIYGNIVRRRSAPQITAKCKLRIFRAPTDCAISAAIYENRKIVRARLIGVAANGHCDRGRPQRERVNRT